MRNLGGARPPDNGDNPRYRCEHHVTHGSYHKNLKRAVPVAKPVVNQTKNAVDDAEDHPGDHARSQKIPRPAKKPKNRDRRKKNEDSRAGNVALEGKALEEWNLVGDNQPGGKNQTEANPGINAGANGRIVKKIQAARTG